MTYADQPPGAGPASPTPGRARTWIVVVTLGWALALVAGVVFSALRGEPTSREQTTVAQAKPVVDQATAELATAATVDGLAVVAVSDFERTGDCAVTIVRGGARYQRSLTALVTPGTEEALLKRVAARLPAGYQARVRTGTVPRLTADAGLFVAVSGGVAASGQVRFVVDTGSCRPEGEPGPDDPLAGDAAASEPEPQRSAVAAVLARLGVPAQRWRTAQVACGGGTTLTTVEAVGAEGALPGLVAQRDALSGALDAALHPAHPGTVVVAAEELFAYRTESSGVGVRIGGGRPVITATTSCA